MLIEQRISGVPVVDAGRVVGVVSRADIARVQVLMQALDGQVSDHLRYDDAQADGFEHPQRPEYQGFEQKLSELKVRDAMRHQVISCPATTSVVDLADLMVRQHIHRIIVVEGERPVGIVSSLDIARLVAGSRGTQTSAKS
jgi:CBS domain-containing protein